MTFSLPSACDSALAYQILCKSDDRRWSCDVILSTPPAKPECPRRFLLNSGVEPSSPIFSKALPTFATHIFSRRRFHTKLCQFCALHWTKIAFFCLPKMFCGPKICFKCVSGLGPRWGSSRRSPILPSRPGRAHPSLQTYTSPSAFGGARHSAPYGLFTPTTRTRQNCFVSWRRRCEQATSCLDPRAPSPKLGALRCFRAGYGPVLSANRKSYAASIGTTTDDLE